MAGFDHPSRLGAGSPSLHFATVRHPQAAARRPVVQHQSTSARKELHPQGLPDPPASGKVEVTERLRLSRTARQPP
jgi:hypothetical protein